MKKTGILLLILSLLILNIFSTLLVHAQETLPLPGTAGGINEETGLPKSFDKFKEASDKLSKEEERKEYLKQEWTKLLADKKAVGPALFYTNKFFSFFNPLWRIIFKMEFEWSWLFIFTFLFWIFIIILVYSPVKELTELNPILSFLGAILVSSLAAYFQFIQMIAGLLIGILKNIWFVTLAILIIVLIAYIYKKSLKDIGKKLKEKQEKFLEKRNREFLNKDVKKLEELTKGLK